MGEERRWEMDGWRGERGNCISDVKIIIIVIIRKNNWRYKQFFIVYGGAIRSSRLVSATQRI